MLRTVPLIARRLIALSAGAGARSAQSRTIRTRPITLIVPFAAGGPTDIIARILATIAVAVARAERHHRQPRRRRRQHRHGAWWRAPTRTATRCCSPRPRSRSTPALFKNLPYDPIKDFAPISELVNAPNVLFVRPDSGITSIADLVAKAKAEPNKFNYASPGVGTKSHLTGELLKLRAGINMAHVPFRGGGPATQARGGRHGAGRLGGARRRSSR